MERAKIKIVTNGITVKQAQVFLNDQEISAFTYAVNVQLSVGMRNRVYLELFGDVEIDGEFFVEAGTDEEE